eukprot:jgi/Botrbrau1/12735/Bobra.67_1s0094.1
MRHVLIDPWVWQAALATRDEFLRGRRLPKAGPPSLDTRGPPGGLCCGYPGRRQGETGHTLLWGQLTLSFWIPAKGSRIYQLEMLAHIKRAHPDLEVDMRKRWLTGRQAARLNRQAQISPRWHGFWAPSAPLKRGQAISGVSGVTDRNQVDVPVIADGGIQNSGPHCESAGPPGRFHRHVAVSLFAGKLILKTPVS